MTYRADDAHQLATFYDDNDANDVKNQLWQIFTFNDDPSKTKIMLYNIGSKSFLIWDNNNYTSFSNDFSKDEEKYLYYTWDANKHLHVDGPKGKVIKFNHQPTFDRITIDKDQPWDSRVWNLEEYDNTAGKIKTVESVEINQFPATIPAVSNVIPENYRIGLAVRKHMGGGEFEAMNRNNLKHKANGCVYGYGKMNYGGI